MKRKTGAIVILAFIIIGSLYFYYGYLYKDARNISTEEASFSLPAAQLVSNYKEGIATSDKKYLNKTIEITGVVTSIADSVVIIDSVVFCSFDILPGIKENDKVAIKGRCIGYDELFNEVKLDQCIVNK
ncbi:OB-fold protein [Flavobacterium rhizosphaerae]|uniref:tRNA_anti-like n=1 Tax=Flavobacterium rhizosphaerae TaxID=3163298 RepID=A0ABW8YXS6_9FLAO